MLLPLLLAGCAIRPAALPDGLPTPSTRDRPPEVRFLPAPPPHDDARWLLASLDQATWDAQLARAVDELILHLPCKTPRLTPSTLSLATARAGYPGQARFTRLLNGGAPPDALVAEIATAAAGEPVDVALSRRSWGDGTTLWLVGWAPHRAGLDPLPRDLPLDGTLAVRAELPAGNSDARLFVAGPTGPVEEMSLSSGTPRWVDRFHEPGAYRLEVVAERAGQTEVVLLFSVFVESEPPAMVHTPPMPEGGPDPIAAETTLFTALNQLREQHGLQPVRNFPLFVPLVREHSAWMANLGVVAHALPGVTAGVPARATEMSHPGARHYENVAVATTAEDALALVADSPGHLRNLLCEACTHAAIGVALEPTLGRRPRLFVTWELMEFPQGPPQAIDHYDR